jgi:uncharacterized protein YgiM (DUF1202 family)
MLTSAVELSVSAVDADSGLKLRSSASQSGTVLSVVPKGEKVIVLSTADGWCFVSYLGGTGYMMEEYLTASDGETYDIPSGRVTVDVVNMRSGTSTGTAKVCQLTINTAVDLIGIENGWYKVTAGQHTGYIHPDYIELLFEKDDGEAVALSTALGLSTDANGDVRSAVVEYAKQYIGTKYKYGGRSPSSGFDCSGFVYYVFKNFGYSLNPGASTQLKSVTKITKAELLPGDLVFFNNGSAKGASHVGIYVGDNKFIHAVKPGYSLTITSLDDNYYARYYVASGRVFK